MLDAADLLLMWNDRRKNVSVSSFLYHQQAFQCKTKLVLNLFYTARTQSHSLKSQRYRLTASNCALGVPVRLNVVLFSQSYTTSQKQSHCRLSASLWPSYFECLDLLGLG